MNVPLVVTKLQIALINEKRGCDESAFCGDENQIDVINKIQL